MNIVSVVLSAYIDGKIDIENISDFIPVEYEPDLFHGAIYRNINPKFTVIIFNTGRMRSMGTKSINSGKEAIRIVIKKLLEHDLIIGKSNIKKVNVENIVGSGYLGFKVDLYEAGIILEGSLYEPEQFPGLICKMGNEKGTIILFKSGKINIMGLKTPKEICQVFNKVKIVLTSSHVKLR